MNVRRTRLLLRREVAQALSTRWFVAYALVFFAGGLAFAVLGTSQGLGGGGRISLRALVGLMHLILIVVPPMAMLPAIALFADDEEGGLLEYLLAQPVDPREIYVGKWAGASTGITLAILLGLIPGIAGALLRGAPAQVLVAVLGLTVLLGWSLVNPVEAFRLAVLSLTDPDLSLFGPTAASLMELLGTPGLVAAGFASLLAWTGVAGLAGLAGAGRRS